MTDGVRGIVLAPKAMARPTRPAADRGAIEQAMAALPAEMSLRSRSRLLAQRVAAEVMAADRRTDPMEIALAAALASVAGDPVAALADALAGELVRRRIDRFEARGCRQLPADAWRAESEEIEAELAKAFAENFRNAARKWVKTGDLPKANDHRDASINEVVR